MDWDSALYLKFGEDRTQVSRDLARRVAQRLAHPRRIVDLGCGPGNSTEVLARLWPQAERVLGLDASAPMLAAARHSYPTVSFIEGDIPSWATSPGEAYDLVFSNSALQWIPNHERLLPQLFARVASGGALAFQVPADWSAAVCQIPRDAAAAPPWRPYFADARIVDWHTHELGFFYDLLAPLAAGVQLWETAYVQVMENVGAIAEWYRGSGLPQYLHALPDDPTRERFLAAYLEGLRAAYPPRADGRVLFPFRRRFVIAWAR